MNEIFKEKKENVVAGIVGAFLFSLAGAVVWVLLHLVGFVAAISGLVGVVCAIQGYKLFAGVLSKKGVIISCIIALLVLVLAWYGCFVKDIYDAYKEWYANGEVDYMPTYFQCFGVGYNFLADPEIAKGYLPSLGLGLVFAVIGALRYVINAFKQAGAQTAPEAASQPDLCAVNSQPAQFTENPQSDPFALQQDGGVTGGENGEKNG